MKFLSQWVCYLCKEKLLIFASWFYNLIHYWMCLAGLNIFWWSHLNFLHIESISKQEKFDFLLSYLYSFLFLFVALFLWLKFQVLYWIKVAKVNSMVLLLILEKILSAFPHSLWCWLPIGLSSTAFIVLSYDPLYLTYLGLLSWKYVVFWQKTFLQVLRWSFGFYSQF
jgi:hypothetical protein